MRLQVCLTRNTTPASREKEKEQHKLKMELIELEKKEKKLERKLLDKMCKDFDEVKVALKELKNQIGEKKNQKNIVENILEMCKKNLGIDDRKNICSN